VIDVANALSRPNSYADLPKRPPPPEPKEGEPALTPRRVHEVSGLDLAKYHAIYGRLSTMLYISG
jgi:hypothetical protein